MKEWIVSGQRMVEETTTLDRLVIQADGALIAPEGKFIQLTVDGVGHALKPGTYNGDIVLTVADVYEMPPHGLMLMMGKGGQFRNTAVIHNNEVQPQYGVPALVQGGSVTGKKAEGIVISSEEDNFNGLLITGDSDYTVSRARIDLDGHGFNDFLGNGAGIAVIDNAHVTIEDSEITMSGVTRCAIHVGGDSVVRVKNCRIENHSPADPDWMGDFSWGMGVLGSNRLVQLCDDGTVYYENCDLKTNGWGVFSIDGCNDAVSVYVKDCNVDLSGPKARGYGAFCIGDRNVVSFNHSRVHVNGYPLMVRGMIDAARAEIVNGCEITGNLYGVLCMGDKGTPVTIADSSLETGKSTLVVKGSSTRFDIRNAELKAGNGVILQLMDNDDAGMAGSAFIVPVGVVDEYVPGRDLTAYDPEADISMVIADSTVVGDFLNSTSNIHPEKNAILGEVFDQPPTFGGMFVPPAPPEGMEGPGPQDHPEEHPDYEAGLRGPKNLHLTLKNARIEGVISSATQAYREGLVRIDQFNRTELSNITQTPAPTVNNGVVVTLDKDSTWIVTGTSYLTSLDLAPTAIVKGFGGKAVKLTVDGAETALEQGKRYTGKLVLSLAD